MARVLLTGGTGFVGSNLARRLLRDGHELHLLVRSGYATWRIAALTEQLRLHQLSLEDDSAVTRAVRAVRPDWVFHLATHGAYAWQTDTRQIMRTVVTGTVNLLLACVEVGFEAFVNAGSSSELGYKDHPASEDEPIEPNSDYAVAKASATFFCQHTARRTGLPIVTLRLYSAYGPYEEPGRLLPAVILNGLEQRWPPLANPDVARDFVYADDVSEAFLLAATRRTHAPGAIYHLGTGVQTSLREVVGVARRVLGIAATPEWSTMADRQWDATCWVADNRKIRSALGWHPAYDFETGFRAMVRWFQENAALSEFYRASPRYRG